MIISSQRCTCLQCFLSSFLTCSRCYLWERLFSGFLIEKQAWKSCWISLIRHAHLQLPPWLHGVKKFQIGYRRSKSSFQSHLSVHLQVGFCFFGGAVCVTCPLWSRVSKYAVVVWHMQREFASASIMGTLCRRLHNLLDKQAKLKQK